MLTPRTSFLLSAAATLAVLAVAQLLVRPDPRLRNRELFTEMAYSQAYGSFAPHPHLPGGATAQPLVAGVVVRGGPRFSYGPGPDEALRAGAELVDPLPPADAASAAEGAALFGIYCTACHDARGTGAGRVVQRGMVPPPSLHGDRARLMRDGELFHVITRGQGNMASHAAQLDERERWLVVRHVRRLQEEGP